MENLRRRRFIKGFLILPVLGLFLKDSSDSGLVQWTGILELPKKMSWPEFKVLQNALMDLQYVDDLEVSFSKKSDLLKVFTVFDGTKVTFTYVFRNRACYEKWNAISSKALKAPVATDYTYTSIVKSVSHWDVDWSHPKNKFI
jgi:hypothetical protein